jgi:type I restriction enzyme R subunit
MQPVVVNLAITFTQLVRELVQVTGEAEQALVRDQFVAKLQRKTRYLCYATACGFETRAGISPEAFIERLKTVLLADIAAWFTQTPDLGDILDRQGEGRAEPVFVSPHDDTLLGTERGYGQARRPEDYLQEFSARRWTTPIWCSDVRAPASSGSTAHQYVTELTYLLFLKMAKETGTED